MFIFRPSPSEVVFEKKISFVRERVNGRRKKKMLRTVKVDVVFTVIGFLVIISSSSMWHLTSAHVALTFPPARKFDLDFLDNLRTPAPCGMPKGERRTTLAAGSTFNVTWHLAYPHRGGHKLELLNDAGKPWMDLTPVAKDSDFVRLDPTTQTQLIRLPLNLSCKGCTIRLKREAAEWANNYTFWSCADVDVIAADVYIEDCSAHGKFINGACICQKLYSGPRCQYKDECWDDSDCGEHGKCIDIAATDYPKKQCYCQLGWFGPACNKESPVKATNLDLSHHQRKDLSETFQLYWQVLHSTDEIEFVLKVRTSSYVAIGWRPKGMTDACKAFPPINDNLVEEAVGVGITEPEPESEPKSDVQKSSAVNSDDGTRILVTTVSSTMSSSTEHFVVHKGNVTEVDLGSESESEPTAEETSASEITSKHVSSSTNDWTPVNGGQKPSSDTETEPEVKAEETSMAESNRHPITLDVTTRPVDVKAKEEEESEHHFGGAETAHDGEVNYGIESADDGLVEYSYDSHTTPSPKSTGRRRSRRQTAKNGTEIPLRTTSSITTSSSSSSPSSISVSSSVSKDGEKFSESTHEEVFKPFTTSGTEWFMNSSSEPSVEPTYEASSSSSSELAKDTSSEPTAEHSVEPISESTSELNTEPSAEPVPEPTAESSPEPLADQVFGSSVTNSTYSRHAKARKENELAKSIREPEYELPPTHAEPATGSSASYYTKGPYTPKLDYHAMDCTDIVSGVARDTYSRIQDLYTRDRSTPRDDGFWGGLDSLTAASGFEKDGVTTVVFRRKLQTNDETDHAIKGEEMHVIWAKGQEQGSYVHHPLSGLEREKPSIPNFYRDDEFKYHGHRSQRGVTTINFFDENKEAKTSHLRGEWKLPKTCTVDDCEYRATWELIPAKDAILFTIATNNSDKWTGIGFSEDTKMPNTDAILGWVDDSGRTFIMDTWIEKYNPPLLDESQDVDGIKGSKINGRVTLSFVRKRNTGDTLHDLAFTDTSCLYMIFIYDGGVFNAVNKKIRKHSAVPAVSDTKICIDAIGGIETPGSVDLPPLLSSLPDAISSTTWPSTTTLTVPPKPQSVYLVAVRLPNQTLDDAIERGIDFKMLIRERLIEYMTDALKGIHHFEKVDVTALESEKNESHVVAKLKVYIDDKSSSRMSRKNTEHELESILNATIAKGKVGRLLVDPNYLVIQSLEVQQDFDSDGDDIILLANNDESLKYVVIAAVIAFGILLIIQIICMIHRWRTARKTRVSKERLIGGTGWKDYAAPGGASGGYGYENFGASNEETPKIGKHPIGSNGTSRSVGHGQAPNGASRPGHLQPGETRSLNRNPRSGGLGDNDRSHYSRRSESLPRPNGNSGYSPHDKIGRPSSAASLNPQGGLQPDFYFMPSQRRYSGEVVRVYVDYNNPNFTGK